MEYNGFQYIFWLKRKISTRLWEFRYLAGENLICKRLYGHRWFCQKYDTCVWKNGYEFCDVCDHEGYSFFCGERAHKCPHPTPFVADDEIDLHQYFNMSVESGCILLWAEMEKQINCVNWNIQHLVRQMNPELWPFTKGWCMTVLTLDYVNTEHLDSDKPTKSLLSYFQDK